MLKGFRDFALRDDLITVAVGLVMALATFTLVQAVVGGLIAPIVTAVLGQDNLVSLSFSINGNEFLYGAVIEAAIAFVATAAAVYFFVVVPFKAYQERRGIPDKTRSCPECTSSISVAAKRCPHCTASVAGA